eukprot:CAMPEP_0119120148 /NCGR_PEP_ID=MMETSP1310-20130426/1321_1 /TAXON_ID=464262 /ORGANISM="Genus nov. species nov., Strain RCC2339" /LENGTH=152 /DNA_ID=CAMNT_0007109613 /DNA_START=27 /DNA_END=485 /DNA_ORIENTATION=+
MVGEREKKAVVVVLLVLAVITQVAGRKRKTQEVEETFSLRPNRGADSVEVSVGSHTCVFRYDIVGGSSEDWTLSMTVTKGDVECVIHRPQDSYLYFLSFDASISGVDLVDVSVYDNTGEVLRNDVYYISDDGHVRNEENWEGTIREVVLFGA